MSDHFLPMLAATIPWAEAAHLPAIAQTKIDGIRCIILNGKAVTRSLKPIPNAHIRDTLEALELPDLDGELTVGQPAAPGTLLRTQSAVMTKTAEPRFTFHVFDAPGAGTYVDRLRFADDIVLRAGLPLQIVCRRLVTSHDQLRKLLALWMGAGWEGVVLRSPAGLYKHGRAMPGDGTFAKLKHLDMPPS